MLTIGVCSYITYSWLLHVQGKSYADSTYCADTMSVHAGNQKKNLFSNEVFIPTQAKEWEEDTHRDSCCPYLDHRSLDHDTPFWWLGNSVSLQKKISTFPLSGAFFFMHSMRMKPKQQKSKASQHPELISRIRRSSPSNISAS